MVDGRIPVTITFDGPLDNLASDERDAAYELNGIISDLNSSQEIKDLLDEYELEVLTINVGGTRSLGGNLSGAGSVNINLEEVAQARFTDINGVPAEMSIEHAFVHELVHAITGLPDGPIHNQITNQIIAEMEYGAQRRSYEEIWLEIDHCFLADTSIRMWPLDPSITPCVDGSYDEKLVLSKVWHKPISEIAVGDIVVAFDKQGRLQPDRVTRTMQNHATHILDFWGTGVTPGHACYCADGPFKGEHVPIMDILRMDTAMMRADGTMFRASTNCTVGTMGDIMIHAAATVQRSDGSWTQPKPGKVRFGTRVILPDGRDVSLMELAHEEGWKVTDAGYMVGRMKGDDGTVAERAFHFPYLYGKELPKPEDYILQLSAVTLEEIYQAGEWEQIGTRMPAPFSMADFNSSNNSKMLQASKPRPNIPPAFTDHPDTPVAQTQAPPPAQAAAEPSMNRKQHKAAKMR